MLPTLGKGTKQARALTPVIGKSVRTFPICETEMMGMVETMQGRLTSESRPPESFSNFWHEPFIIS